MFGRIRLAYLAIEVRDLAHWRKFAAEMLGLPVPSANSDGSIGLRLDKCAHRLILSEGPHDDIRALGWEVDNAGDFDALIARAAARGAPVTMGDATLCAARRVQRLAFFTGPDAVRNEIVIGLQYADTPFASSLIPGGFRTAANGIDMGLGHAVLVSADPDSAGAFYQEVLSMRLSQHFAGTIGPIKIGGTFLHCNPRHHSLALFRIPHAGRLQHVMIEANDMRDVGQAWERAQKMKVPITLTLGQHPEPDGMVSFYGMTPSRFEFEIGAAGMLIDPAHFQPITINVTSDWGHHPTLRAKWNLISAAIRQKFAGKAKTA